MRELYEYFNLKIKENDYEQNCKSSKRRTRD